MGPFNDLILEQGTNVLKRLTSQVDIFEIYSFILIIVGAYIIDFIADLFIYIFAFLNSWLVPTEWCIRYLT